MLIHNEARRSDASLLFRSLYILQSHILVPLLIQRFHLSAYCTAVAIMSRYQGLLSWFILLTSLGGAQAKLDLNSTSNIVVYWGMWSFIAWAY